MSISKSDKRFLFLLTASTLIKILIIYWFHLQPADQSWIWHLQGDQKVYNNVIEKIHSGLIPYVDFNIEYPPIFGLLYWGVSFLFHGGLFGLVFIDGCLMLGFDLAVACLLWRLLNGVAETKKLSLIAVYLFSPSLLILSPVRFDVIASFFALLGYWAYRRGKPYTASIILACGIACKWIPAFMFFAIVFREWLFVRRRTRAILMVLACLATLAALNLPFAVACYNKNGNMSMFLWTYAYHFKRGYMIESLGGIFQLWAGPWQFGPYPGILSVAAILAIAFFYPTDRLAEKFILICIAFVVPSKVYSPQFHIWMLPFLLIAASRKTKSFLLVIVLYELFNIMAFPFSFTWLRRVWSYSYPIKGVPWQAVAFSFFVVGRGALALLIMAKLIPSPRAVGAHDLSCRSPS